MTSGKHRKRMARRRAARTGEPYTTALRHIRAREEVKVPAPPENTLLARCSFCAKPNTDVKKLIAGPGVYICDGCVGLCQEILATETSVEDAAARREAFVNLPASEVLQLLPSIAATVDSVEGDLRRWIQRLRAAGTGWDEIASRLGISADEARSRFEPPRDE